MEIHPPRILVIDDDKGLVANLKDAFEAHGYDVDGAATGEDGLSLCRENTYDVLLIDIKLPDMDGLSLIRRLTWQSQPSDCIVITGHASLETAIGAAGEQRVAAFERKPLDIERLLALINQIVQRRQTERALHRSEERFRNLMEYIPGISIHGYGTDGTVVYWNRASEEVYGYSADEALGKNLGDLIVPPDLRPLFKQSLEIGKRVRSSGQFMQPNELMQSHKKGHLVPVYSIHTAVCIEGKEPLLFCIDVDLSERKKAEEALREASDIINRSPAVAFLWKNQEGWPVEFVSNNVRSLLGYTPEEFTSRKVLYARTVHPEDIDRVAQEVVSYSEEAERSGFAHEPYRIVTRDGRVKWVEEKTKIRRDEQGNITHYEGIVEDITERMQLEERLLQAEKLEAIGRLAGGIAHDFNNILTVILGNLDLLRITTSNGESVQDEIGEISDAAIRASDLTRQLLAFSRKQIIAPRAVNLNDVVADMETMLRRLIREDIRIETFFSSDLPSIKIDPIQVQQVVLNLALNARDAMLYGGELAIRTGSVLLDEGYRRTHPSVEPGPYVMLTVSDTGEGMDKETLSHIFEPFYTTKEMGRGLGLGLSTVYGIVEQSGGHVSVNSERGRGSCFRTYFPAVGEKATLVKETLETEGRLESATHGHGETILVVDDEEALTGLIKRVLRSTGYKVEVARNAGEAIATCLEMGRSLDLLLTDLVMPEMGGRDLAESVSSICPHLKVLFMSGYSESATAHTSISDDGDGIEFINKPFGTRDLLRRIEAILVK